MHSQVDLSGGLPAALSLLAADAPVEDRPKAAVRFDHPLFLIAYPYIAPCSGAWMVKGS